MTELNEVALHHHNIAFKQRMYAINQIMHRLNDEVSDALLFTKSTNVDRAIVAPFEDMVMEVVKYAHEEAICVKHDLRMVSRCNHFWIDIQPIVGKDDMRRYFDFMHMSYKKIIKDVAKLCQYVETRIHEFHIRMAEIIEYTKAPTEHTNVLDCISQTILKWFVIGDQQSQSTDR